MPVDTFLEESIPTERVEKIDCDKLFSSTSLHAPSS